MGLDMYLKASKHVSGYDRETSNDKTVYGQLVELFKVEGAIDKDAPSADVSFTVAYWRKANQIHKWFVDHVQKGVDECQLNYTKREQLEELRDLCAELLEKQDVEEAQQRLPSSSGFFFGSTSYNEYYWADLRATVSQLNRALSLPDGWSFYYRSSW